MLAWAVLQTYLLTSYGVPFWYAAADAAITGSMLVSVGMLINFNLQFYLPQKEKYWYIIVVSPVSYTHLDVYKRQGSYRYYYFGSRSIIAGTAYGCSDTGLALVLAHDTNLDRCTHCGAASLSKSGLDHPAQSWIIFPG